MKKPARGSLWQDENGVKYRVAQATKYNVLLIGSFGPFKVPSYEWPGQYSLVEEEDSGADEITALLVGGATGQHFERLWEQAAELGVDIEYHWPISIKVPTKIPREVNLVIELVSHVSHNEYAASKKMAKEQQIPVARAPSGGFQHSLAEELKKLGFGDEFGAVIINEGPGGQHIAFVPHKRGRKARQEGVYTWTGTEYVYTPIQATELAIPEQHEASPESRGSDAILTIVGLSMMLWAGTR